MKSKKSQKKEKNLTFFQNLMQHISTLNTSKFFTGVVMLTLNISSKYVTLGLSTTQEEYLKYTLGRQILIFAILWMGTRDIVIALILTCVFILFADYLFNDNSSYCIIPSSYIKKINDKDDVPLTHKEINDAISVLKKARLQKEKKESHSKTSDMHIYKGLYKENFI